MNDTDALIAFAELVMVLDALEKILIAQGVLRLQRLEELARDPRWEGIRLDEALGLDRA